MRNFYLVFIILFCAVSVLAQKPKADSLNLLLVKEKTDTGKVRLMWELANATNVYNPDSGLILAKHALAFAKKIKSAEGESRSLGVLANNLNMTGNYARALEIYLQKQQLDEKSDNPRNFASSLINIGSVYVYLEEYRQALSYYYKADSIIEFYYKTDSISKLNKANATTRLYNVEELRFYSSLNLGDVYDRLNVSDSAFKFFNKALGFATTKNDGDLMGLALTGMGHSYLKKKDYHNAMGSYITGLQYLQTASDDDMICEATLGLAKLYHSLGKSDSAEYYARNSFLLARDDGFQSRRLDAAVFLTDHFKNIKNIDSAFSYAIETQVLKDSLSSKERIRESQIISSNEQLRQLEIEEKLEKAREERSQQLQLLLIGIFIPGIFLITLLLSRIKIHDRVIRLLGILSLLLFFEYLTLLLHPVVSDFTHHTPVYEMLIFVSIAALLIPSHHRLEHWLIEKLTSKKHDHTKGGFKIKTAKMKIKKPSD